MIKPDWYQAISTEGLSEPEKTGIEFFQNFYRAIQSRAAEKLSQDSESVAFDVAQFEQEIDAVANAELLLAILSGISSADRLLSEMFSRERSPRLEMKGLLSPLGPLGDFNKRLKIGALAGFIAPESLAFFDELRKLRNNVAHGSPPQAPTTEQIERVVGADLGWIEAIETDPRLIGTVCDRTATGTFRASIAVNLAMLAWQTILLPMANARHVPISMIIENPPKIFNSVSAIGFKAALSLLNYRRKELGQDQ